METVWPPKETNSAAHLHTENSEKQTKKRIASENKNNETTEAEQKYIFLRAQ